MDQIANSDSTGHSMSTAEQYCYNNYDNIRIIIAVNQLNRVNSCAIVYAWWYRYSIIIKNYCTCTSISDYVMTISL